MPACLSASWEALALAHRRRAGAGWKRGAARKAERARIEDMAFAIGVVEQRRAKSVRAWDSLIVIER